MRLALPSLADVHGHDFRGFYRVQIAPRILESFEIRKVVDSRTPRIDPAVHFPHIMHHIRREMVRAMGENVDRPY